MQVHYIRLHALHIYGDGLFDRDILVHQDVIMFQNALQISPEQTLACLPWPTTKPNI
jgi:hypothetical protein